MKRNALSYARLKVENFPLYTYTYTQVAYDHGGTAVRQTSKAFEIHRIHDKVCRTGQRFEKTESCPEKGAKIIFYSCEFATGLRKLYELLNSM